MVVVVISVIHLHLVFYAFVNLVFTFKILPITKNAKVRIFTKITHKKPSFLNLLDIDECVEYPHLCHQHCLNTNGSFVCGCDEGFILQSDERTCKIISKLKSSRVYYIFPLSLDESGIRLITTSGSMLAWMSPTTRAYGRVYLGSDMRYINTFDVDNRTNTYFWSDFASKGIYSRSERATNYTRVKNFVYSKNKV